MRELVEVGFWFTIVYYTFANLFYILLLFIALRVMREEGRYRPLLRRFVSRRKTTLCPPISIILPAYNEEASVVGSVSSILLQDYADFNVIVVNDGSKDRTMARLIEAFDMEPKRLPFTPGLSSTTIRGTYRSKKNPRLILIDKENGGKADALNCGISFSRKDLVCCLDADSLLEKDALLSVALPFIESPDTTIATGGTIRVVNGSVIRDHTVIKPQVSNHPLVIFQIVEYIRSFMCGRVGWNALNSTLVISGAFGLFCRSSIISIGGYEKKTVGEDMEVVMELHKHYRLDVKEPYKIIFMPDPVCWTEVPETISTLRRQRSRWQRGLLQSLSLYKEALFNFRMGTVGMIGYPYFLFIELLSPAIELLSYVIVALAWYMGILSVEMAIIFFFVGIVFGMIMTVMALVIEELYFSRYLRVRDFFKLLAASFLESFGYRQFLNLVRLLAFFEEVLGIKQWGTQQRKGFQ